VLVFRSLFLYAFFVVLVPLVAVFSFSFGDVRC
jgi:hypothetical protein